MASMPKAALEQQPQVRPTHRHTAAASLVLEWTLLGLALASYVIVFLATIFWSLPGFIVGLSLAFLVAGISVYLRLRSRS